MKRLIYILLFAPIVLYGQENDPCYSINNVYQEIEDANLPISLDLLSGWNMIGYGCTTQSDAQDLLASISDKIIIAKNNAGSVYMPEFGFNGIGDLLPNQGYLVKMSETVIGFELCTNPIPFHQVEGCTDCAATNFYLLANVDDGSCQYNICTDPQADNYQEVLPCIYYGCNDPLAANYDPYANTDDGSCVIAEACPYDNYLEYSPDAISYNANLCVNIIVEGCTENTALNYNPQANLDDESCEFIYGCMDPTAGNYNAEATNDDSSCIYYGCIDPTAGNYDETAFVDDGSCLIGGCKNPTAENYNHDAEIDDGSCVIYGCLLPDFPNYNSVANTDDGSCNMNSLNVFGCTDITSNNYQETANIDNGSCIHFLVYSNTNSSSLNDGGVFDSNIMIGDNLILNDTITISIHINIEHSYLGDLSIFLTSPNGVQVMLVDQVPSNAWLGEASDNGNQNIVGYEYGWSMNPTYFGTMQDGVEGGNTTTFNISFQNFSTILNSDTYLPLESLNEFSGINLNGMWTLTIIDNLVVDDGLLFSWSIHVYN